MWCETHVVPFCHSLSEKMATSDGRQAEDTESSKCTSYQLQLLLHLVPGKYGTVTLTKVVGNCELERRSTLLQARVRAAAE